MTHETLHDLYVEQLRDIYSAEEQLIEALPGFVAAASTPELQEAFQDHLHQTEQHLERLERIFDLAGINPNNGKRCMGMAGMIEEGNELRKASNSHEAVRDAGLIAEAQKMEHYEIAAYGTVCAFAEMLGEREALQLLEQTIVEEKMADRRLTRLAEDGINASAMHG